MADNLLEFNLQLDDFIKKVKLAPQTVTKRIAFDLFGRIVRKTPVDTGRARGSWTMSVNEADERVLPPAPKGSQNHYPEPTPATITLQPGDSVIISNSLPYIVALEQGRLIKVKEKGKEMPNRKIKPKRVFSIQAPHGMVAISIEEVKLNMQRLIHDGLGDAGLT